MAVPADELCFSNCTASTEILVFDSHSSTQGPQDCQDIAHPQSLILRGPVNPLIWFKSTALPPNSKLSTVTSSAPTLSSVKSPVFSISSVSRAPYCVNSTSCPLTMLLYFSPEWCLLHFCTMAHKGEMFFLLFYISRKYHDIS